MPVFVFQFINVFNWPLFSVILKKMKLVGVALLSSAIVVDHAYKIENFI